jgi:predicted amidohydrolase YtcJ
MTISGLLTGARLLDADGEQDLLVADGRIAAIAPAGRLPAAGVERIALGGRFVVPGLWDSHVHFTQWVVRRQRFDLSGCTSAADAIATVAAVLERPEVRSGSTVLVGYGFRDGLWPDTPSVTALDAVTGGRPTVLVSGDLHCGWLNSAAARHLGVVTSPTGILAEREWLTALHVLDSAAQPDLAAFRAAADAAAARGVVGIVDFENARNVADWPNRVAAGVTGLRVQCSIWPDLLDEAIAAGLRTGQPLDPSGLTTVGRLKIVADGSLNTRTALCFAAYGDPTQPGKDGADATDPGAGVQSYPPEEIEQLVGRAYRNGILPAVHAIGDRCNHEVLAVFERLGIAGTIEHAQLVDAADLADFGRLGITASVQPEHAMDDRDIADRYWGDRIAGAFAYRSLHDAGAALRLGSDAPVAPLDPWIALSAAVFRSRDGREPWHPEQRLPWDVALAASTRNTVAVGQRADLAVLDADPRTCDEAELRAMSVAATFNGGRATWNALT